LDQLAFLPWFVIGGVIGWVVGRTVQTDARPAKQPESLPSLANLPEDAFDELKHQQRVDLVGVRADLARSSSYLEGLAQGLAKERTGYLEPDWNHGPSSLESAVWDATHQIKRAVDTLKLPSAIEHRAMSEKPPLDRLRARPEFERYQFEPSSNLHLMCVKMPLPNGSWILKNAAGVDLDGMAIQLLKELDEAEAALQGGPSR
jgi:hypothetical protein